MNTVYACVLFMSVCVQVNESECFWQKNELGQMRLANCTTLRKERGEAGGGESERESEL